MLPSIDSEGNPTGRQMIGYYLSGALLLGIGILACAVGFSLQCSRARARAVLRASLIYLPALLTLLLLDGISHG